MIEEDPTLSKPIYPSFESHYYTTAYKCNCNFPKHQKKDTSCITGLGRERRKNVSAMSKCFLTTEKEICFLLYLSEIDGEVNE